MVLGKNENEVRYPILMLFVLVLLLIGGNGGKAGIIESTPYSTVKDNLQAIYLSDENGYFSAAEISKLNRAELTDDFSEFIHLADQYPDAVLFIDNNAIKKIELNKLKTTMAKNERMLMVGYEDPYNNIGLEEYWEKPIKETFEKVPKRGFCHFILLTDEMHYDLPGKWQKKLPLLYRQDNYAFYKTMDEQMTGIVNYKKY